MAIGDVVASFLGAAITNRQPSSGVEEQISAIVKDGTTDTINLYDGSNALKLFITSIRNNEEQSSGASMHQDVYNTAVMITNSIYLRKTGTTDIIYVGGVQTNVLDIIITNGTT